jgi:signal peptide peptidase SppA
MAQQDSTDISLEIGAIRSLVPRIADYFGVWAMHPETLLAAAYHVQNMDLRRHIEANAGGSYSQGRYGVESGGIAVIEVAGTLMKSASSVGDASSTIDLRKQVRTAAQDPDITALLLRIDSPGGTVSGTKDLADEVRNATKAKTVYGYIEDMGASASYWVGSQCTKLFSNDTATIGSIGTLLVVEEREGKVHVISTGSYKGAGTPGSKITEEHIAEWQRNVNALNEHFLQGVSTGRGLSLAKVRELADGRVHIGLEAKNLGLIDAVQSFDETLSQLQAQGSQAMAATTDPVSATIHQLRDACPGADSAFLLGQLEAGATVSTAQKAWMVEQNKQLTAEKKAREEAEAIIKRPKARPGVRPLSSGKRAKTKPDDEEEGDPEDEDMDGGGECTPEQFTGEIRRQMARGANRATAVKAAGRRFPDSHKAYLLATNKKKVHAKINDRFDDDLDD